nr:sulfate permease 2 [Quercus suber]
MSTITGNIVGQVMTSRPDIPPQVVASALAIIAGGIVCFIGLIRIGWLVEFISLASISAFMTGSAINIGVGQFPNLMGLSSYFNTRDSTYLVVIHSLQNLPRSDYNAALGVTALFMLYAIRGTFNYLARKQPHRRKLWFFCNTLRTAFVILLYTLISWLMNLHLPNHDPKKSIVKILGKVPRGFQDAGVPRVDSEIISLFASQIPVSVIVLLIEHISIAKSFGRVNNYVINPSQELVAIGVTNLLGPFLGAYPATGSFSRTAIKSKAGVRTPLAGLITAVVVIIAIYGLTAVFFYIPQAALAAVIIHAVGDLITPPNTVYQFWKVSPIEVIIFFAGVFVTVFSSIENGVYTTVATSFALLVWRLFLPQGRFLGRVKVHSVIGDNADSAKAAPENDPDKSTRNIFIPINHGDGSNPDVQAEHPYPGIFIYRFSEGYNYPNANRYLDYLTQTVFETTRRTNPNTYGRPGDRPWNDPGPRKGQEHLHDDRPILKAIILDFSSVNNVDITSVQNLIDVRNQLDRYAAPHRVQWHFACINNRWTKRAIASAGFGYPTPEDDTGFHRWKPVFSVAEIGGLDSAAHAAEEAMNRRQSKITRPEVDDIESADSSDRGSLDKQITNSQAYKKGPGAKIAPVQGLNRPFFHIDLTSALQSAIQTYEALEARQGVAKSGEDPVKLA